MRDSKPKLYIAGIGMITPVGANTEMTTAAVEAGVSVYKDSPHFNKNFNPMRMALVPETALQPLDAAMNLFGLSARQRRMLQLAAPALTEVLKSVVLKEPPALFLALPESIPSCPVNLQEKFIDMLMVQSKVKLNSKSSKVFASGRAGGIQAIDAAFKYLYESGHDVVLIGGVDTYLDHYLLSVLDEENRILAEGIMDGFVPGESAGFLLLVSERVVSKLPKQPVAMLYMPGIALELGHRYSDQPYSGDGLANALRQATGNANGNPVKVIYSSMNGENFGAKEYGVALLRNSAVMSANIEHKHPADCFGDIGAAFAPVLLGMAACSMREDVLCYCASDNDLRAAVSLTTYGGIKNDGIS